MTRPPPRSTLFPYTPLSRSGWDGDRLIHTERQQHGDDTRHIEHTIYEPGSFTPLVRLSTTASGDPQNEPHLLVQAIAAGLPDQDDPNHRPALALMQIGRAHV